jgi:hypothetical protein
VFTCDKILYFLLQGPIMSVLFILSGNRRVIVKTMHEISRTKELAALYEQLTSEQKTSFESALSGPETPFETICPPPPSARDNLIKLYHDNTQTKAMNWCMGETEPVLLKTVATNLAKDAHWEGFPDGSHIGFATDIAGQIYATYSGAAEKRPDALDAIKRIFRESRIHAKFVAGPQVDPRYLGYADMIAEASSSGGSSKGCVEKKLLSHLVSLGKRLAPGTLAAFRISSSGSDAATAKWAFPCKSCCHCVADYKRRFSKS